MKYVDVVLPLPLTAKFTYLLPSAFSEEVKIGCRVIVPFGSKKMYTALVVSIHEQKPEGYEVKEVLEVLDKRPVLLPHQFKFWQWIAEYYMCAEGDVYKAALPSGMKLESESQIQINENYSGEHELTSKEQLVVGLLLAVELLFVDLVHFLYLLQFFFFFLYLYYLLCLLYLSLFYLLILGLLVFL